MATFRGNAGVVTVSGDEVFELMEFSVEESSAITPDTVMGDDWETHLSGIKSWTATISVRWDDTASGNGQEVAAAAFASGSAVSVLFYPEGTTSTSAKLTGTATVTSVGQNQGYENTTVMRNISLTGTGSLVHGTV